MKCNLVNQQFMRYLGSKNLFISLLILNAVLLKFSSCKSRGFQDQLINNKPKERKWNKWRKKKEMKNGRAYNPYLEKKASEKPSAELNQQNKRAERLAKRAIRKEKRKLRRKKGAYK
ncbi:MAG: hypothetical protein ACK5D5_11680 [Bacteroidota bacterium]|jgi:hypothetical protein